MRTSQELLQERKTRIRRAIALEKNDRPPVVLQMDAFCARHMGVKLSEFTGSIQRSHEVMLASIKNLGNADASERAFGGSHIFLPMSYMSRIKLPGRDLPDDNMWQMDEHELISIEDYDVILSKGWPEFFADFLKNKLNINLEAVMCEMAASTRMMAAFEEAGYAIYTPVAFTLINECLGGGRSMAKFMRDLYKIPDKVEAVLDVIQEDQLKKVGPAIKAAQAEVVFVSPSRGASAFFAPKLWERFVWKYLKKIGDAIIAEGAVINVHADGDWERDLEHFREFPKGKCVFEADHGTDMYKLKEKIGDWCAIKGDVPAALLACGTPDEVYRYCKTLIKDMGDGFILSSGCTIPDNAKVENVRAMISAATD